jgi:glycosyltransferase involved in cell wall biosynthesis
MTYYDRQFQLDRTLESIARTKYKNYEVVIVDDGSREDIKLGVCKFPITILKTVNKQWINPEPAYNKGIYFAMTKNPDIIILQNAECCHLGDIISKASEVTDGNYFAFGCYSIDEKTTFNSLSGDLLATNNIGASKDGQNAWYNHSKYRPVAYDFCSAITATNLKKLNGYDERLSDGCGYGDDYLLARIRMLGLKVEIIDSPFVVHQWHYNNYVPKNKGELVFKNKLLIQELIKENNYRAKHILTQDL